MGAAIGALMARQICRFSAVAANCAGSGSTGRAVSACKHSSDPQIAPPGLPRMSSASPSWGNSARSRMNSRTNAETPLATSAGGMKVRIRR